MDLSSLCAARAVSSGVPSASSNLHGSLDLLPPVQNSRDITYLGNDGLSVTAPGPLRLRSWRVGVHWRRGLRHETVTRSDQSVAHGVSTCGYSIILFHRPHTHPTELSPPLGSLPHLRFPPCPEDNRADQWSTDPSAASHAASHAASLQPTGGRQCVGRGGPDGEAVANRHSKLSPLVTAPRSPFGTAWHHRAPCLFQQRRDKRSGSEFPPGLRRWCRTGPRRRRRRGGMGEG